MKDYFYHIVQKHGLVSYEVVDHLTSGVFVVGLDTKFHYVNKPLLQKFALTGEECRERSFLDFIHPADREYAHSTFQSILAGVEVSPVILRYQTQNSSGTIEIRAGSLKGEHGIAGIIGVVQSVEETIFHDFDCLTFLELLPLPVAVFSIDGLVEYINPSFANTFGYVLEEVRTFDEWFLKAYPDGQMRAKLRSEWEADLAAIRPGTVVKKTLDVTCKDGREKKVTMSLMFIKPQKFFLITEEISDIPAQSVMLEERLLNAQRMEPFGVLAGMLAHDFNNILSGIMGNISLLKKHCGNNTDAGEIINDIESFSNQGASLAKGLLALAQGSELERKIFDINEIVRESATIFGRLHGEIRIHFALCETRCPVRINHTQIEQVLLNLFINAHQAMQGGGSVYLSTAATELGPKSAAKAKIPPGKYAVLSVRDTGCGMDAITLEKIFEPFFSTKEKGTGSGLGLASAREIIKQHGGAITVESTPGVGTIFIILLPLAEE